MTNKELEKLKQIACDPISQKFLELRMKRGISPFEICRASGVFDERYRAVESGQFSIDELFRVAHYFGKEVKIVLL